MKLILLLTKLVMVTALQAGWKENTVAAMLVAEAGIDGRDGMECVAEVLLNRAASNRVPAISLVDKRMFSSIRGTTPTALYVKALKEDKATLKIALQIADVALNSPDKLPRRVHGATHFCQTKNKPWWAKHMLTAAVVKHHTFYRPR